MKNLSFLSFVMAIAAWGGPAAAQFMPSLTGDLPNQTTNTYVITESDRSTLRTFGEQQRSKVCDENAKRDVAPPCVTADMTVTVYPPGSVLPVEETAVKVPSEVTSTMATLPNTQYVYAANNVYLIETQTRRILDVVTIPEKNTLK